MKAITWWTGNDKENKLSLKTFSQRKQFWRKLSRTLAKHFPTLSLFSIFKVVIGFLLFSLTFTYNSFDVILFIDFAPKAVITLQIKKEN